MARNGFVGIKYPAQHTTGGRADGASNYVIFNEADAKIVNRVEFLLTPQGVVYGWTDGKKVYLTKDGMNPETPIHEYTHIWARAMMQNNPEGWQSVKDLLRGTPIWNEVINGPNYSGIIENEDAVASEALSRMSGKENARRMEQEARKMIDEANGIMAKAEVVTLIERMRKALQEFWSWVGKNLFDIKEFGSVEEVTDRVLYDLVNNAELGVRNETATETTNAQEEIGLSEEDRLAIERMPIPILRKQITELVKFLANVSNLSDEWIAENSDTIAGAKNLLEYAKRELARKEQLKKLNKWGIKVGNTPTPFATVRKMFEEFNTDEDIAQLFERVASIFETLPIRIVFSDTIGSKGTQGWFSPTTGTLKLPGHFVYGGVKAEQYKAETILHEMIHAVTSYALYISEMPNLQNAYGFRLSDNMYGAIRQLKRIYSIIKVDGDFKGEYGITDVHEMVAELSNPQFRAKLKQKNLWEQIVDAIKQLFGITPTNALEGAEAALDYLLNNFDRTQWDNMVSLGEKRGKKMNIGVEKMASEEIDDFVSLMKSNAKVAPFVEITEDNWVDKIQTPIGEVKMGDNQKDKLFTKGREKQYGMLLETLSNPDLILEESDAIEDSTHERPTSYLFIKTFQKEDGSKYVHFESVTVLKGGLEVSISSHIIRENQLKNKMKSDRLLYKATALDQSANSSAEQSIKGGSLSSTDKGSDNVGNVQGLEGYSEEEIKDIAKAYIEETISELGLDARVIDVAVYGSRSRRTAREDSDLDIVVEYSGNEREDTMFNILNDVETALEIDGVKVDINPITKGKSGSLSEFMQRVKNYDRESEKEVLFRDGGAFYSNAEEERMAMRRKVDELAGKISIGDKVEVIENEKGERKEEKETLSRRKARAKGWFDPKTGKIVINLSNHTSVADVERTLLHEAVAHYGLRELFGKQFDTLLDNVYNNAEGDVKTQIDAIASNKGVSTRVATEEYLAGLAETMSINGGVSEKVAEFWNRVKAIFKALLDNIGITTEMSDGDLQYILWSSYRNLTGSNKGILAMAEDVVMRERFGVGSYATTGTAQQVAERGEVYSEDEWREIQKEESSRQFAKVKELLTALKEAGHTGFHISRSVTDWGVSTYLQGDAGTIYEGIKYRISDHSVSSSRRVIEDRMIDYDTSANDIVAEVNNIKESKEKADAIIAQNEKAKEDKRKSLDEKWERIKHFFAGLVFQRNERTYQNFEQFASDTTRSNILQKDLGNGAFSYEYTTEPNGYGKKKPTYDYIEAFNEANAEIVTTRFKEETIGEVNERFNAELQQQIDGVLPKGHIYQLGMPGDVLLATGIANAPIQLNSQRLLDKSSNFGHDYELSELKDLVKAINNPIAIFAYGDKGKAQNIVVEIQHEGKNFIVGISIRPTVGGQVLDINSIRNVFPKDNAEWLNWIAQGKALYLDKERVQDLINQQRTNLADVGYLDLNSIANIIENFENPTIEEAENYETLFRDGESDGTREEYNKRVRRPNKSKTLANKVGRFGNLRWRLKEAYQDSMLSLKALQEIIAKKYGIEEIPSWMDAYMQENLMSSRNKAANEVYERDFFNPLLDAVKWFTNRNVDREDLVRYMFAKHGLERNRVLAERDAKRTADEAVKALYAEARSEAWKKTSRIMEGVSFASSEDRKQAWKQAYNSAYVKPFSNSQKEQTYWQKAYNEAIAENRGRDYSGLTALTGEEDAIEFEVMNGGNEAEARKALERIKDRNVRGGFVPGTNKIIIFAFNPVNAFEILFHEHSHYAVEQIGGVKSIMTLVNELRDIDSQLANKIEKYYPESERAEEMITYSLGSALYGNAIEALKEALSPKAQWQLEQILEELGYEKGIDYKQEVGRHEPNPKESGLDKKQTRTRRRIAERNRRRGIGVGVGNGGVGERIPGMAERNAGTDESEKTIGYSEEVLFRDGESDGTREEYNKRVRRPNKSKTLANKVGRFGNLRWRLKEAYQDSMLSLKALQEIIAKKYGIEYVTIALEGITKDKEGKAIILLT